MKESELVGMLRKNFLGVIHRNHGSGFGTAGLPDLEGCFRSGKIGRTIVIEAKVGHLDRNNRIILKTPLTNLQEHWLGRYFEEGALALLAIYLEDSQKIVFLQSPWRLHINSAFSEIDFLKPKFLADKVWIES